MGKQYYPRLGDAVKVKGHGGVAFRFLGHPVERVVSDDGFYEEHTYTSAAKVRMVGDDEVLTVNTCDLTPLTEEDFCHECGQIACKHG